MQTYFIFAGINGAGKTALYNVLKEDIYLGERISIDDIVKGMGDWKDPLLQIKGARLAMKKLDSLIESGTTFHQETTLPGETVIRFVEKARDKGFLIVLYFVGVENVDIAVKRVNERVLAGGHGIAESVIRKRFEEINSLLKRLIPLCNEIYLYDNTKGFRQVAVICEGETIDADGDLPVWIEKLKDEGVIEFLM